MADVFPVPINKISFVHEIPVGKAVWELMALRGNFSVSKAPIVITSDPYVTVSGSIFVHISETLGETKFASDRSLLDANICAINTYNDHYWFHTQQDAFDAADWMLDLMENSAEISRKINDKISGARKMSSAFPMR